ncbi:DMP19 family protein [Aeromonas hydrophila]|nr:DMP19 family protein [Aeromonas hydrophila]
MHSYGLLEKEIRCFSESKHSLGRDKKWKQLARYEGDENYEADLESLDTELYIYEDNLTELLHKFVRENKVVSLNV